MTGMLRGFRPDKLPTKLICVWSRPPARSLQWPLPAPRPAGTGRLKPVTSPQKRTYAGLSGIGDRIRQQAAEVVWKVQVAPERVAS
jgi:hypothetical protein